MISGLRAAALRLSGMPALVVIASLLVPLLVLYRRLLFEDQAWLDFDFLLSYGPRYELLQAGIRAGEIPLWSDGYLGGFPVAFSEFGWFYPITWLFLAVLPMPLAYHAEAAFGLLAGGLLAYWLARTWGLTRIPGLVAAYLYMFGPFVFATSRFLNYADIFFVLPAGLLATEQLARGRLIFAPALAAIIAVAIIAGHPQIALIFVSTIAAYGIFRIVGIYRESGPRPAIRLGGLLVAALVLALAAGAPRLLPVLAITGESTRAGGLDIATAAGGSASPWSLLLGYIYPSFEIPKVLGDQIRAEPLAYSGLLAIPLIVLALRFQWRRPAVVFLAGLGVVAWILALGSFTPVFEVLHRLPLWGFFRQPGRFIILVSFAMAFLTAFGLEALREEGADRRTVRLMARILAWYAAILLIATVITTVFLSAAEGSIRDLANRAIDRFVVGGVGRYGSPEQYYATFDLFFQRLQKAFTLTSWTPTFTLAAAILSAGVFWALIRRKLSPRAAVGAAGVILAADVFLSLGHGIDAVPAGLIKTPPKSVSALGLESGGRVLSYRGLADKWELSVGTGDRLNRTQRDLIEYMFLREVLTPNLPMRRGIDSIDGYENLMSGRHAELLSYLGSERTTIAGFASDPIMPENVKAELLGDRMRVLAAYGIDRVLSGTSLDAALGASKAAVEVDLPEWAGVDQTVWIYEVPGSLGGAYVTEGWRLDDPSLSAEAFLEGLSSAPLGTVFVDLEPDFVSRGGDPVVRQPNSAASDTNRTYRVAVERPSLLVVNSYVGSGWSARIDGRPAKYLTANRFAAAVALEPGAHVVEFTYSPPNWTPARWLGVGGGVTTGLVALLVGIRSRFSVRRPVRSVPEESD